MSDLSTQLASMCEDCTAEGITCEQQCERNDHDLGPTPWSPRDPGEQHCHCGAYGWVKSEGAPMSDQPRIALRPDVPPPMTIRIGPHDYEVRADADTGKLLRDEHNNGDSRPDQHLIRLDVERPHTGVAETLLHEAMHCAWTQTSMQVSDNLQDHQEAIITSLAPLILGMLRHNPRLVAYLTETRR